LNPSLALFAFLRVLLVLVLLLLLCALRHA